MKRLLIFGLMAAIVSLAILSCKDDFNEEDFLRQQSELKLQQDAIMRKRDSASVDQTSKQAVEEYIAAINEAGDLLAVTIMVRENGLPVPGVTVSMTSSTANAITSGRTQALQTAVTDASGNVVFDRVAIGSGTISFSKTGYITATGLVDFGTPSAPQQIQVNVNGSTITKYLPPVKRFEEAIVQMFSATAGTGSTATITGRVSIENDVTNNAAEVPAGVVIRANLTNLLVNPGSFISALQFVDNNSLGVATVAADGTYSMIVPATATGPAITLIVPNIEGTCRMAVNGYDNGTGVAVALALPEYRNVPTSWGPQAVGLTGATTIPSVAGARVVLPSAPAAGAGLTFDFTPVGRSLGTTSISSAAASEGSDGTWYKITNRGSYTGTPPTVTITGGGGSGATAIATLRTLLTSITVANRGSGYGASATIELRATLSGGGTSSLSTDVVTTPGGLLPETISLSALDGSNGGFGTDDAPIDLDDDVTSLSLVVVGIGTGGAVTGNLQTELSSVTILTVGTGYTSAPTFVFGGAGVNTPASVQVVDFPVFWSFEPNNTASTDYPLVPDFTLNYAGSAEVNASTDQTVNFFGPNGVLDLSGTDLQDAFMLSNGDIVKKYPARVYRTPTASSIGPTMTVVNEVPDNAKFTFAAANIDVTTGKITAVPAINAAGNGYNARMTGTIVPTIAGAPGSGAALNIIYSFTPGVNYNDASGEWSFTGIPGNLSITNPGSGYLPNLNQKAAEVIVFGAGSAVANAQAGKSYTVNIAYGTGIRKVAVN